MRVVIKIGKWILNLIYHIYFIFPANGQILIVSRQSDAPSLDIRMLKKALQKECPERKVKVLCRYSKSAAELNLGYLFYMVGPLMWNMSRASVVVLDGFCIPASNLKHRKSLKIIQMWHAMGAFKKFGYAVLGEKEGYSESIAELMNMHKNYDCVFVSSEICRPLMQQAYHCDIDRIKVMPLPRVDFIRREDFHRGTKEKILNAYPELMDGRPVVLYAPTFRKGKDNTDYVKRLIEVFDFEKFHLVVKHHPLVDLKLTGTRAIVDHTYESVEWLCTSDVCITDYSAFILEAALKGLPIYRYEPDADEYLDTRGFFVDVEREWPGKSYRDPAVLMEALKNEDAELSEVTTFADKYVTDSGHCTKDMAAFIAGCI